MVRMAAMARQPILATGNCQAGFTLLELMVIVALIGLISVSVSVNFSAAPAPALLEDQQRLLTRQLRHLSDKAVSEQRWYGLQFTQQSYQVVTFTKQGWQPVQPQRRFQLADSIDLTLLSDNRPLTPRADQREPQIYASPDGLLSPIHIQLRQGNIQVLIDDVYAPAW